MSLDARGSDLGHFASGWGISTMAKKKVVRRSRSRAEVGDDLSPIGVGEPVDRRNTRLRFEQWVRNPSCGANTASAILGVGMAEVARRQGLTPTMGQSPFAIARGLQFERVLFREGAARLREALEKVNIKPPAGFRDLRLRRSGGPMFNLDEARAATEALLRTAASGGTAPGIVAGATLKLPGRQPMLPEAMLALDILLVTPGEPCKLMVGEVKTYPDRGGYTDRGELATARAQAGVYVHALDEFRTSLGLDAKLDVDKLGFLVLSRPGSNFPVVRAGEDLKYQAERARRGLERLRDRASELARLVELKTDPFVAITSAECHYAPSCVSFCDRAAACFKEAMGRGDATVLGEDVRRFVGEVPLARVVALLGGDKPATEAEQSLWARVAAAGAGARP